VWTKENEKLKKIKRGKNSRFPRDLLFPQSAVCTCEVDIGSRSVFARPFFLIENSYEDGEYDE